MSFAFDLISDLHIDTWGNFSWQEQATSPICVVAGDLARDRNTVIQALQHLGKCYQAVFYIDGNDEHTDYFDNLGNSYKDLTKRIEKIPNVVYLQDNVVIVDGIAILGTNGWWGFDFDLGINSESVESWCQEKYNLTSRSTTTISRTSNADAEYMITSVRRLQTHNDVKKIVMVTHTVPDPDLISHDLELTGKMQMNVMGNRYMMKAAAADTENKIHTWCFGHYHGSIDQVRSGIRFVNNCRGRSTTAYAKHVYHPLRIVIDF